MENDIRVAKEDQIRPALSLVYDSYIKRKLIEPNPYKMRVLPCHILPTTYVIISTDGNEISGTVTFIKDGIMGLPIEKIFPNEVDDRRARGIIICEASCLADKANNIRELLRLMSYGTQCASVAVHEILIAVHPRHASFYQRFLGFDMVVSKSVEYSSVKGHPAVMLSLDVYGLKINKPRIYKRIFDQYFPNQECKDLILSKEFSKELSEAAKYA